MEPPRSTPFSRGPTTSNQAPPPPSIPCLSVAPLTCLASPHQPQSPAAADLGRRALLAAAMIPFQLIHPVPFVTAATCRRINEKRLYSDREGRASTMALGRGQINIRSALRCIESRPASWRCACAVCKNAQWRAFDSAIKPLEFRTGGVSVLVVPTVSIVAGVSCSRIHFSTLSPPISPQLANRLPYSRSSQLAIKYRIYPSASYPFQISRSTTKVSARSLVPMPVLVGRLARKSGSVAVAY